MSGIFGLLGLNDGDREFLNTFGQQVVYDAIRLDLERHNMELAMASEVFIDKVTEDHTLRYKLPGGGRLPRRGGLAQSPAGKPVGQWDVAFPLEDFGTQLAYDRINYAYMTVEDLDRHLNDVFAKDINVVRFEMLRALFLSTARSFEDERNGTLSIKPLANGDGTVYPPVVGSEFEAEDTHYLEAGYAASAISDTNNPYVTIKNELEEHFGVKQGGSNIAVFIHGDQVAKTEALADYEAVSDPNVARGANSNEVVGLPRVPGVVIGRTNGVWVVRWDWVTSGWQLGVDLDEPAPLQVRVHPAFTNLPRGLQLVAENEEYPISSSHYEHSFGFGVANRLNGVAMKLANSGSYTAPAIFN